MSSDLSTPHDRQDHVTAAYVNAALKICATLGVERAESLLRDQDVPADVIDRVLRQPALVRKVESHQELWDATVERWSLEKYARNPKE